ncbi:cupin domain-containing protein [Pantoea sp. A4]|uniref:cupin domain-containing protein n=1 Tax=Pantoea sp. A4 TaxID=1225184 RepID=UPI00036EC3A7|nr:cupin domain-containing protein [Pantoea sp. A4]
MKPVLFTAQQQQDLSPWEPIASPLSEPCSTHRAAETEIAQYPGTSMGIWDCTPGIWRRGLMQREYCYFLSGHCFFTPDGGETLEIKAGDSIFFPQQTHGTWDVRETVRKAFFIMGDQPV